LIRPFLGELSPDGSKLLLCGSWREGRGEPRAYGNHIELWDLKQKKLLQKFTLAKGLPGGLLAREAGGLVNYLNLVFADREYVYLSVPEEKAGKPTSAHRWKWADGSEAPRTSGAIAANEVNGVNWLLWRGSAGLTLHDVATGKRTLLEGTAGNYSYKGAAPEGRAAVLEELPEKSEAGRPPAPVRWGLWDARTGKRILSLPGPVPRQGYRYQPFDPPALGAHGRPARRGSPCLGRTDRQGGPPAHAPGAAPPPAGGGAAAPRR
jgi:hypothetical protein